MIVNYECYIEGKKINIGMLFFKGRIRIIKVEFMIYNKLGNILLEGDVNFKDLDSDDRIIMLLYLLILKF